MAETTSLPVARRERAGTGGARAVRREGRVPAIIYGGGGGEPIMVSVPRRELEKEIQRPGFFSRLFDLALDGETHRVLPKDLQLHPVTDVPLHVDFLRASAGATVTVDVPVVVVGEERSPGLRRGGVLNLVRRTVELLCPTENIPQSLEVDVAGLDINDSLHISAVRLPEGSRPTIVDRDFTVLTIVASSAAREETAVAAEGAERTETTEVKE
jgi:large subunit ribosomal protein L25